MSNAIADEGVVPRPSTGALLKRAARYGESRVSPCPKKRTAMSQNGIEPRPLQIASGQLGPGPSLVTYSGMAARSLKAHAGWINSHVTSIDQPRALPVPRAGRRRWTFTLTPKNGQAESPLSGRANAG